MKTVFLAVASIMLLFGCTAATHKEAVQDEKTDRVSVAKVQKGIRMGMSGAEVAEVLGTPNIVTSDSEHREVWIYDKVATTVVHSANTAGVSGFALKADITGSETTLKGILPEISHGAGAASSTQKTLTIIIKFDKHSRVRDYSYRTSQF